MPYMRVWMGGSGIHYSLKIQPIIHLIKILSYSLKYTFGLSHNIPFVAK